MMEYVLSVEEKSRCRTASTNSRYFSRAYQTRSLSSLPEPTTLGWTEDIGQFMPVLSRLPVAPDSVVELVKCGCTKTKCGGRCSCRQSNVTCTEHCKCEADEENCTNVSGDIIEDDGDESTDEEYDAV
jgi:hypothetical protein